MNSSLRATALFAVLAALAIALAAGCGRAAAERRDAGDRYLRRARAARDPDDDLPPCVVGKCGDIAHDIHRSALEIDQ